MLSLHPLLHNFSENMLVLIKGTDTFKGIYFDGVDNLEAVPSCIPVIVVSDTPQTSQPCSISRLTSDK